MVTYLERGADLMPLPLIVSCFSNIQIGLPFWYRLTQVDPEKGPLNGCVCVFQTFLSEIQCVFNVYNSLNSIQDRRTMRKHDACSPIYWMFGGIETSKQRTFMNVTIP